MILLTQFSRGVIEAIFWHCGLHWSLGLLCYLWENSTSASFSIHNLSRESASWRMVRTVPGIFQLSREVWKFQPQIESAQSWKVILVLIETRRQIRLHMEGTSGRRVHHSKLKRVNKIIENFSNSWEDIELLISNFYLSIWMYIIHFN